MPDINAARVCPRCGGPLSWSACTRCRYADWGGLGCAFVLGASLVTAGTVGYWIVREPPWETVAGWTGWSLGTVLLLIVVAAAVKAIKPRRQSTAAITERPLTPPAGLNEEMTAEERDRMLAQLRPALARVAAKEITEALERNDYGSALDLGLEALVKAVGENPADTLGQRVGTLLCGLPHTELFWTSFPDAVGSIKDLTEHLAGLYPEESREREMLELVGSNLQHAVGRSDLPDAVRLFGKLTVHVWRCRVRGDDQLADDRCQAFFTSWRKMFGRENRVLNLLWAAQMDYAFTSEVPPD